MSENCKISSFRVLKAEFNIVGIDDMRENADKEGIILKLDEKMTGRTPKNPSDKMRQLELETTITSDEAPELKIYLLSQSVFSYEDNSTTTTEDILQNECYPIAKSKVFDSIKIITGAMGISPLDLNPQPPEEQKAD